MGLAQQGPQAGRAGLWGAADRPGCGVAGAGADIPGGLTWGPGLCAGLGEPQGEAGQEQQGPRAPGKADSPSATGQHTHTRDPWNF